MLSCRSPASPAVPRPVVVLCVSVCVCDNSINRSSGCVDKDRVACCHTRKKGNRPKLQVADGR